MEKPEEGLDSLVSVLKPGGIMQIALYSKNARSEIAWTRKYIERRKFSVSVKNMKLFRDKMLVSKNKKFMSLRKSVDFYSLSNFRDLIFNYNEHTFNLHQIKELLDKKKLKFLNFNSIDSDVMNVFKIHYPDVNNENRIELWSKFESNHPKIFFGMYNFWAKKIS